MLDPLTLEQTVRGSELAQRLNSRAGAVIGLIAEDATQVIPLGSGVDASTPVEIGSVTKAFTGILLAQAVQRGELDLDSRIDEVLFGERWPQPPAISARLLATHQSGLPRLSLPMSKSELSDPDPYRRYSRSDLQAYIRREEPRTPDKLTYSYSNLGYAVLGLMLERVVGQTYAQLMQNRLLEPLGLNDTHLQLTGGPDWARPGYRANGQPMPLWHFDAYAPCGAMVSTLEDLIEALRAFLDPGSAVAQALEFSAAPQATIPGGTVALAWHSPTRDDWFWHNGATFGHTSYMGVGRRRKVGAVIVANQALPAQATQLGHQLMRSLVQPE